MGGPGPAVGEHSPTVDGVALSHDSLSMFVTTTTDRAVITPLIYDELETKPESLAYVPQT